MKKKAKKPLFDPRLPGAKMIFYGAILLIIAGCINAYVSWVLAIGVFFRAAETGDVIGSAIALCAQVALSFLVAIDGINNRNRPSKAKGIVTKAFCVIAISVILLLQGDTSGTGILVAAFCLAGSAVMIIGGFRNAKAAGSSGKGKK